MSATNCCLCNQAAAPGESRAYRVEYFGWTDDFAICDTCAAKIFDGNNGTRHLHRDTAAALAAALLIAKNEDVDAVDRIFPNMASFRRFYHEESAG